MSENQNNNNSPNRQLDAALGVAILGGSFFTLVEVFKNVYNPTYALIISIIITAIIAISGVKLSKKGYKTAGNMAVITVIFISLALLVFGSCALTFRIG